MQNEKFSYKLRRELRQTSIKTLIISAAAMTVAGIIMLIILQNGRLL